VRLCTELGADLLVDTFYTLGTVCLACLVMKRLNEVGHAWVRRVVDTGVDKHAGRVASGVDVWLAGIGRGSGGLVFGEGVDRSVVWGIGPWRWGLAQRVGGVAEELRLGG
jgi:hypothetical protein